MKKILILLLGLCFILTNFTGYSQVYRLEENDSIGHIVHVKIYNSPSVELKDESFIEHWNEYWENSKKYDSSSHNLLTFIDENLFQLVSKPSHIEEKQKILEKYGHSEQNIIDSINKINNIRKGTVLTLFILGLLFIISCIIEFSSGEIYINKMLFFLLLSIVLFIMILILAYYLAITDSDYFQIKSIMNLYG
ncbi:MAG: hypothetical protein ACOC3V_01040 [bacterium]